MLVIVGKCWLLLIIVLLVVPIDVVFLLGLVVVMNLNVSSLKKARPSPVRNNQGLGCRECVLCGLGQNCPPFHAAHTPKRKTRPTKVSGHSACRFLRATSVQ